LEKIKPLLKSIEISIFMGTWCKDSKREVPRFYRILDELKFKEKNLTVFALGIAPGEYKKSPNGDEKGKNILRVPTIIIKRKGTEIGRIIEYPVKSLEEDMYDILINNNYKPNYAGE
jgi:thiol-disulfide isomerase/thioredoxin